MFNKNYFNKGRKLSPIDKFFTVIIFIALVFFRLSFYNSNKDVHFVILIIFSVIYLIWIVNKKSNNSKSNEDWGKYKEKRKCKRCNVKVYLDDAEIQAKKFICPDCNTENVY